MVLSVIIILITVNIAVEMSRTNLLLQKKKKKNYKIWNYTDRSIVIITTNVSQQSQLIDVPFEFNQTIRLYLVKLHVIVNAIIKVV